MFYHLSRSYLPLCVAILLAVPDASSFSPPLLPPIRTATTSYPARTSIVLPASRSSSAILNDTFIPILSTDGLFLWNDTLATQQMEELEAAFVAPSTVTATDVADVKPKPLEVERTRLKRELAHVAITGFHPDDLSSSETPQEQQQPTRTAECIMKELEQMDTLPIIRPAMHHSLNAHWSFVFTGVPTIGMRLITLLSRMSVLFPFEIIDFRDVALCVTGDQSNAKALVEVKICGALELMLEVCTSLRRPTRLDMENEYKNHQGEDGTLLLEHFKGIHVNGVEIPTPKSWHTTRTLEITYMDKDIMVARTAGGEPHLMLRNTPLCYTSEEMVLHKDDDAIAEEIEECDIDGNTWTEFFSEAVEIYGERITRCLVDRDYGREEYQKKKTKNRSNENWWKSISSGLNLGNS